jgi:hypothetical protein
VDNRARSWKTGPSTCTVMGHLGLRHAISIDEISPVILLVPAGSTVPKHGHGPLGPSTCNLKGTTSDIGKVCGPIISVFFTAMLTRRPWLNMPKRHHIHRAKLLLREGPL